MLKFLSKRGVLTITCATIVLCSEVIGMESEDEAWLNNNGLSANNIEQPRYTESTGEYERDKLLDQFSGLHYFVSQALECNSSKRKVSNPINWPMKLNSIARSVEFFNLRNDTADKEVLAYVATNFRYLARFCESEYCDQESTSVVFALLHLILKHTEMYGVPEGDCRDSIDKLAEYIDNHAHKLLSDIRSLEEQFKSIADIMWARVNWLDY